MTRIGVSKQISEAKVLSFFPTSVSTIVTKNCVALFFSLKTTQEPFGDVSVVMLILHCAWSGSLLQPLGKVYTHVMWCVHFSLNCMMLLALAMGGYGPTTWQSLMGREIILLTC